jgi:hypothetical protein
MLACALPVLLGFALPTVHLAQLALSSGATLIDRRFLGDAANSLALAATAAVVIVALALFLSYSGRLVRRRAFNRLIEFASLGYAIPGAVIAVGVLLPLAAADHGIDRVSRDLFGLSSGLLLSGTAVALLLAYTVRFLAVGVANIAPGLAAIDPAMDASARLLGAGPRQVCATFPAHAARAGADGRRGRPRRGHEGTAGDLLIRRSTSTRWRSASTVSPPTNAWRKRRRRDRDHCGFARPGNRSQPGDRRKSIRSRRPAGSA